MNGEIVALLAGGFIAVIVCLIVILIEKYNLRKLTKLTQVDDLELVQEFLMLGSEYKREAVWAHGSNIYKFYDGNWDLSITPVIRHLNGRTHSVRVTNYGGYSHTFIVSMPRKDNKSNNLWSCESIW
jgi:hypothetical protein